MYDCEELHCCNDIGEITAEMVREISEPIELYLQIMLRRNDGKKKSVLLELSVVKVIFLMKLLVKMIFYL